MDNIRNFSIIAHIDHGKSTIADMIIKKCDGISQRQMSDQVLDTMDIERERGITIKAQSVRLKYKKDNKDYILNLIDTPGHIDFSYEVRRSLLSSDGALLVVDASQGVEAQTIGNAFLAIDNKIDLIPVINKIDLQHANIKKVKYEIEDNIGIDCSDAIEVSAKNNIGIDNLIEAIITKIKPPRGSINAPLKACIYDSWFDSYLGVLVLVRVYDGQIRKNKNILMMDTSKKHKVLDLMYPHPIKPQKIDCIDAGEIGIVVLGLKDIQQANIGYTLTDVDKQTKNLVHSFGSIKPFVFAGVYAVDSNKFKDLKYAIDKLRLNDSSLSYESESSIALGFGFRVGFLGLLHMDVVKERLRREFDVEVIITAPTVEYKILKTDGNIVYIQNPSQFLAPNYIDKVFEPCIKASIITPQEFLGNVIDLLNKSRAIQKNMKYIDRSRVLLEYLVPIGEVVTDFYDNLKSITKGYSSFDYEPYGYRETKLIKLDIKIAGEVIDMLSVIVPKEKAYSTGRDIVKRLKDIVPRQLFEVALQASIGNKIIARETLKSMGKDVTAKLYGGDVTRKRKLLEKKKRGKKKMKSLGRVKLPQEAFMAFLKK